MKKLLYIVSISFTLSGLFSCSKTYLERNPRGVQNSAQFFNSPGAAFKAVINCYKGIYNFWGYQAAKAELGNMATDETDKGGSDAGDRPFVADLGYGRMRSDNETLTGLWGACYKAIGDCNIAIENMIDNAGLLDDGGNPLEESVRKRYLAEIRFLRSFYYFDLVRVFGGVPLVTQTLNADDRNSLKKETPDAIFNFIEGEWKAIISDLPSATGISADERGRVTKEAVDAMLARCYLFFAEENNDLYVKARDAALEVINSHAFDLEPDYQDLWLPNGYTSKEAVFMTIFGDNPGAFIYGTTLPVYCSPRSAGAWGFDTPTQDLVDQFETGDPRKLFTILDNKDVFPKVNGGEEILDFSVSPNTGYYNRKVFLIESRRGQGWGDDQWTLYFVRYSDVLLMYAESLFKSGGDKQTVADYINMVRERASNSSHLDVEAIKRNAVISNTPLSLVSAVDDLDKAIKHERRVEFGGEYHRLYDLIRWGTYVSTMHAFSTKPYSNGKGAAFKDPTGGVRFLFPIPQEEIDRSGGSIVQNQGY